MKRRTNLFYSGKDIDESNFLTFSNYTEHLTGVSLATNFKIFPSRFICLYIPKLESQENRQENRQEFIKDYLVAYYENKLAFLRDACVNEDESEKSGDIKNYPDRKMKYLGYLIDAILDYDPETKMVYQSEITEQDYNGTFTDIILTIDSSETFDKGYVFGNVQLNDEGDNKFIKDKNSTEYKLYKEKLYGWVKEKTDGSVDWIGPKLYENVNPRFDANEDVDNIIYYFQSKHNYTMTKESKESDINFNVIIPLYDIVNFDPSTNKIILCTDEFGLPVLDGDNNKTYEESVREYASLDHFDLNRVPKNDEHAVNVPYGIWFANETITLKRSNFKQYAPSWSLLIGTQFKPFPNSEYLYADENSGSKMAGFATFAQILSRQNDVLDKLIEYKNTISSLEDRVNEQLNYISSYATTISQLQETVKELQNAIQLHLGDTLSHTKKNNVHQWINGK